MSISKTELHKHFGRMSSFVILVVTISFCYSACLVTKNNVEEPDQIQSKNFHYPETRQENVRETLHGTVVDDPYRWLEQNDAEEVLQWDEQQNKLTRSILDVLPYHQSILSRIKELWLYPKQGSPVRYGDSYFQWRMDIDQEHLVYWVLDTIDGPARSLLDPNTMGEEKSYSLRYAQPSDDGKLVAYGLSEAETENPITHIINVEDGKELPDRVKGWRQSGVCWDPDGKGFYYSCNPEPGTVPEGDEVYNWKVYHHVLGTSSNDDKLIFKYPDKKEAICSVDYSVTKRYLFAYVTLGEDNDVYYRDVKENDDFKPLMTGFDGYNEALSIKDGKLLLFTTRNASKGKVVEISLDSPDPENWKEFIPETDDVLKEIYLIGGHIYARYSQNTYSKISIFSGTGTAIRDIELPVLGRADLTGRWMYDDVFISFSSFSFPRIIYRYDIEQNKLKEYYRSPIKADTDNIAVNQVWYSSKDSTRIPMYVIHHRDLKLDGKNPTVLNGYGGFGVSIKPYFNPNLIVWLEKGGVYAIPAIRGGSEFGEEWHQSGMLEKRQNVFDDFIAAAQWLFANKYTNPEKLAISGGSNGGLLVAAVTVQRPDLFKAVICGAPLIDMIRYHLFSIARFWIPEYGCSDNPDQFNYLFQYSPYHNVKQGVDYPATLVMAGGIDARVDPMHSRKYVAQLQNKSSGEGPYLLTLDRTTGHGAEKAMSQYMSEAADEWSFLMWQLGVMDTDNSEK